MKIRNLAAGEFAAILLMNTPGLSTPKGWLEWSQPPTIERPSDFPSFIRITFKFSHIVIDKGKLAKSNHTIQIDFMVCTSSVVPSQDEVSAI